MNPTRRKFLRTGGSLGALALAVAGGLVRPEDAFAQQWNKAAFDAKSVADVLKAFGGSGSTDSKDIAFDAPDIAENGAVVPISIESKIPGTRSIAILIEKNPFTLSADFQIPAGTDPFVGTRVKMAETSKVYAVVNAGGKYFHAAKEIKVTIGGCGG